MRRLMDTWPAWAASWLLVGLFGFVLVVGLVMLVMFGM
jgi:hypothetical protein